MKWFKNLSMAVKISLVVALILIIGLGVMEIATTNSVRSSTMKDMNNRLVEISSDRATVIDDYFAKYKRYYKSFSVLPDVKKMLKNPNNKKLVKKVQKELDAYFATNPAMEGMFVSDAETVFLCHSQHEAVGAQVYETDEDREPLLEGVKSSSDGIWVKGVAPAKSTGILVASGYCPVYDDDGETILGFVGGGMYVDELKEIVYGMETVGFENAGVYLLSTTLGNYIFSPIEGEDGAEYGANDQALVEYAIAGGEGVVSTQSDDGTDIMLAYSYIEDLNMVLYVYDTEAEIYASINTLSMKIIVMALIILALSLVVVVISSTMISKEIRYVTDVIVDLGSLDLTKAKNLLRFDGRKDEVGQIAKAAWKLTGAVSDAVENLMNRAGKLADASGDMQESTDRTSGSMSSINDAAGELANSATNQAENISDISAQMQDVEEVMRTSMENTRALSDASAQIRETVESGLETVDQLKGISSQSKDVFDTIFEGISNISESADKISEASDMIKSISSQTNLLSLNASIEAARAGEAGKGFAVVADEIRNLSDQSAQSAEQINTMLEDLIRNTEDAVRKSDLVRDFVDRQQSSVKETADSFTGIADNISGVNSAIDGLENANKNLEDGVRNIASLVTNLSAISEENAATAEELNATTENVNSSVGELDDQGKGIAEAAKQLEDIVGVFRIGDAEEI